MYCLWCMLFSPFLAFLQYFSQLGVKAYHFLTSERVCFLLKANSPLPAPREFASTHHYLASTYLFLGLAAPSFYVLRIWPCWKVFKNIMMSNLFLFP